MQWQAPKIPVIPQQDGGEQRQENYPEPQNPRNQPGLSLHVHQENQNRTCLIKVKKGEPFSEKWYPTTVNQVTYIHEINLQLLKWAKEVSISQKKYYINYSHGFIPYTECMLT